MNETDILYRLTVDVNTDGDFLYDRSNYESKKDFDTFDDAFFYLLNSLSNITDTMRTNKPHVRETVNHGVSIAISIYRDVYDDMLEITKRSADNRSVWGDTIHLGNQEIRWEIDIIEVPRV